MYSTHSDSKEFTCSAGDPDSIPGSGRPPGEKEWLPTPLSLPRKSHVQRSLVGKVCRITKNCTQLSDWAQAHIIKPTSLLWCDYKISTMSFTIREDKRGSLASLPPNMIGLLQYFPDLPTIQKQTLQGFHRSPQFPSYDKMVIIFISWLLVFPPSCHFRSVILLSFLRLC